MTRLILIGAGGHGKVAADIAADTGWREIVFVDSAWPEKTLNGVWPVIGGPDTVNAPGAEGTAVFVTIGDNTVRARFFETLDLGTIPVLRHPSSVISRHSTIGEGSLLAAGAIVNVGSTIGRGVIVNTAATVDHDCTIGDFTHISPGAHLAGNVTVGKSSWIGIGASVRQWVTIGDDVQIGAGAAVVQDIPDGATAIGVPARISRP